MERRYGEAAAQVERLGGRRWRVVKEAWGCAKEEKERERERVRERWGDDREGGGGEAGWLAAVSLAGWAACVGKVR